MRLEGRFAPAAEESSYNFILLHLLSLRFGYLDEVSDLNNLTLCLGIVRLDSLVADFVQSQSSSGSLLFVG